MSIFTQRRTRLYLVIAVLLVLLLVVAFQTWQTWRHASSLRAHLEQLRATGIEQPRQLSPGLALIQQDLRHLSRDLRLPLAVARYLGWLPVIGPTVEAAPVLLESGTTLLDAGVVAWQVLEEPMCSLLEGEGDLTAVIPQMSAQALAHRDQLEQAATNARAAAATLEALDAERLVPQQLATRMAQAQTLTPLLTAGFDALPLLPELVPPNGERTWLLLAQNNEELRPTGGFISNMGVITLTNGLPVFGSLQDSYQVEDWNQPHPDPPQALREQMGLDLWVTRDANWWPDFPTSAAAIADLYTLNQGTQVDGVLAVDMAGAMRLLETLTPLRLPNGTRLERGSVAQAFRDSWSLPEGSLVTPGMVMTATQPFVAIDVELYYHQREGKAWFDSVSVTDLSDPDSNLVVNPSFEEDADGDGLPDGWEAEGLAASDGLVTDYAHAGARSLYLLGDPQGEKVIRQRIPVSGEAGTRYRISTMSRGENILTNGGPYAMIVTLQPEQGPAERTVATFPALTHDWATAGSGEVLAEWWDHRKDIVNHAMQAAMTQTLLKPGNVRWMDMLQTVQALLTERRIQVYAANSSLQALFERQGWSGKLAPAAQDYLLVVDTNVGYNKVSANVEQSIDYDVTLSPEGPRARLTVRYTNHSAVTEEECNKFTQYVPTYEQMMEGCYWDYVRVYVPQGAQLVSATGGDKEATAIDELGRTVFDTTLLLRPGESRELSFEYRLPSTVIQGDTYALIAQKQAGTEALPLTVSVAWPEGSLRETTGMAPEKTEPHRAQFHTDLSVDRQLEMRFGAR
ncbi:MAG: DUF4012 domain-containing protein [Chloroflexi bacterium]|nr:DUF4012 domain-containing protein [Chloroflexota bacterium]